MGGDTLAVLVVKDQGTNVIMAHPVMCKGRGQDEAVQEAVRNIERLSYLRSGSSSKLTKNRRWSTLLMALSTSGGSM